MATHPRGKRPMWTRRFAILLALLAFGPAPAAHAAEDKPAPKEKPELPKPTSRTVKMIEGWTVRVDDRLLKAPDDELGTRAMRFLENKLSDIKAVVPADKVKKLQTVTIVLDLTHGKLG